MTIKRCIFFIISVLLAFGVSGYCQTKKKERGFRHIDIVGHMGSHIYTGENLTDKIKYGYGAVEIRLGWYPKTQNNWSSDYGNPSYGIGVYSGAIGDPKIFGKPNAVFGFINFPLHYSKRTTFSLLPSLGLTYNLQPYNPESNPTNDAIGGSVSVYFSVNLGAAYHLNRELDFLYGLDFTHFSNGRMSAPNHGLNMLGLSVGVRYNYNADRNYNESAFYKSDSLPSRPIKTVTFSNKKVKAHLLSAYGAIGLVQQDDQQYKNQLYTTSSLVVDYSYRFATKNAVTAGLDWFYDASLRDYRSKNLLGIHLGYDFMFWKMTVKLQSGTYLTDNKGKGIFFLRPALKYNMTSGTFVQVGLKTLDGAAADWIEFGVGINILKGSGNNMVN